ncbi:MAG: hypothetical protein ACRC6C_04945 [Wolbachia pipientis]
MVGFGSAMGFDIAYVTQLASNAADVTKTTIIGRTDKSKAILRVAPTVNIVTRGSVK